MLSLILGFVAGAVVGFVVGFFVFRNNPEKAAVIGDAIETKVDATVSKITEQLKTPPTTKQ